MRIENYRSQEIRIGSYEVVHGLVFDGEGSMYCEVLHWYVWKGKFHYLSSSQSYSGAIYLHA